MKPLIGIREAIADPKLIGAALGNPETFFNHIVYIAAALGERLNRQELRAFRKIAGSRKSPRQKVRELWVICGRRGGKTRMAALLATYLALCVDWSEQLAAGEIGYVLLLAPSKEQASIAFSYIRGFIEESEVFSKQVVQPITSEEIRLRNGITITTTAANFRTVRGRTILAAIFDESAYWRSEESATPDYEIYRSVIPPIVASGGFLIGISSAYRKAGLLYSKFKQYFGVSNPEVLVIRGTSEQFNPTLNSSAIQQARDEDPEAASAEWDSEFRSDLSQFLDDEDIDAAVDTNRATELRPDLSKSYFAAVDASGGRHDAYCVAIGHREHNRIVVDVVRRRDPPFNPTDTTEEFANLVKDYGIHTVEGDNYAASWVSTAWESFGVRYRRAEKPKSALYIDGLPAFTRRQISIPNDETLIRELRILERRTSRSGRDTVSDPAGNSTHDDSANALFILINLLRERRQVQSIITTTYQMA
ncbi:MAG TPA: terminase [Xanthobacteraceae bacterium]|nr:terminase [Xanthobacteraceae bacterium]